MTQIDYIRGDATAPQAKGTKVIAHLCNDRGGRGKGFVLAVSKRWPQPESAYRAWYRERAANGFALGAVQLIQVETYLWVANLIGQHGTKTGSAGPPVRYDAIATALATLSGKTRDLGASVQMPRIGCGLAGGRWERIEPLITKHLTNQGIPVTVYDFG